jgi:hypothetical protein
MRRRFGCDVATSTIIALFLLFSRAALLNAQTVSALLPDSVAERVIAFYNADATTRFSGDARIAAGTALRGGVAAIGASLIIEGTVEGDVVVINGNLEMRAGGRVTGSATVVGGTARAESGVDGGVRVFREPLRYREQDGRLVFIPAEQDPLLSTGRDFPFGRTDIFIASQGAYNRVEGLPIAIGPRIRFSGANPTTAQATIIVRTAVPPALDPRRFGFTGRAEQLIAPSIGLKLGARLYSVIVPIESWGLSDQESALSTFLLHQDYRDHFMREGWSLYGQLAQPGTAYTIGVEFRDERHASTPNADPITVIHNGEPWRAEPSVAEGSLRSIIANIDYDTRNDKRDPSDGWLIRFEAERGLGGSLTNPASFDPTSLVLSSRPGRDDFTTATLDLRRYARLSPYARLSLRAVAAGSLDGKALPPQRQHALGGEGSLPGYRLFEFDCGARRVVQPIEGDSYHPHYGCDQLVLVQLEYQAGFPFARRITNALGLGPSIGNAVRWAAFFDAGRAWNEPAARDGRLGGRDDFSADAGLGLRVGPIGAYWAVPLSGAGHGYNFFVRIGPRL